MVARLRVVPLALERLLVALEGRLRVLVLLEAAEVREDVRVLGVAGEPSLVGGPRRGEVARLAPLLVGEPEVVESARVAGRGELGRGLVGLDRAVEIALLVRDERAAEVGVAVPGTLGEDLVELGERFVVLALAVELDRLPAELLDDLPVVFRLGADVGLDPRLLVHPRDLGRGPPSISPRDGRRHGVVRVHLRRLGGLGGRDDGSNVRGLVGLLRGDVVPRRQPDDLGVRVRPPAAPLERGEDGREREEREHRRHLEERPERRAEAARDLGGLVVVGREAVARDPAARAGLGGGGTRRHGLVGVERLLAELEAQGLRRLDRGRLGGEHDGRGGHLDREDAPVRLDPPERRLRAVGSVETADVERASRHHVRLDDDLDARQIPVSHASPVSSSLPRRPRRGPRARSRPRSPWAAGRSRPWVGRR